MSSLENDKDYVLSLEKGIAVIKIFNQVNQKLTLTETAELLNMTRATARRFLKTLQVLGYLETDSKYFWLSPKILELSSAYYNSNPFAKMAQHYVKKISILTQETCTISILQNDSALCIAMYEIPRIMNVNIKVGDQLPLWLTANGRVLLAHTSSEKMCNILKNIDYKKYTECTVSDEQSLIQKLKQTKEHGYCIVNQEYEKSLVSLAVPLKNNHGEVIASIGITGADSRFNDFEISRNLEVMFKIAEEFKNINF